MTYSYDTLNSLLQSDDDKTKIAELQFNMMPKCHLVNSLSFLLSDQNPLINTIKEANKRSLLNMAHEYSRVAFGIYSEIESGDLNIQTLLDYYKRPIYYVKTIDGYRVATEDEVEAGILELEDIPQYAVDREVYEKLITFMWTLTGFAKYYKELGYTLTYTDSGERIESDYDMIVQAGQNIKDLVDWLDNPSEFDVAIRQLKASKKAGKYRYPKMAVDEITPDTSIKQIIFNLNKEMPYRVFGELAKAKNILYKMKKTPRYKMTTEEKILLRRAYYNMTHPEAKAEVAQAESERQVLIRDKCKVILDGKATGLIPQNHFAFKIIGTLKTNNFKFCSKKQETILDDAITKIKLNANKRDEMIKLNQTLMNNDESSKDTDSSEKAESSSGMGLVNLSDILGSGMMENI